MGGLDVSAGRQVLLDLAEIQGLDDAARPIMTASQSVSATMRTASSGVMMSPLPMTGILTASFTSAMRVQSALPL